MDERRLYPRINVTIFIKLKNKSDISMSEGESIDISEGGICIKSKAKYSPGNIVILQLFLGDKLVDIEAKVIWVKKTEEGNYDLGLEYVKVESGDMEEIKKYLEEK